MAGIVETKVRRKRIINSIVNHKKEIETLIYVICALVILWIFVSFIEVNMHNMTDHIYSKWNFFTLLIEIYNKIGRWFHMQTENTIKEICFNIFIAICICNKYIFCSLHWSKYFLLVNRRWHDLWWAYSKYWIVTNS